MPAARRLWSRDAPAEAAVTRCLARREGEGEAGGGRGGGYRAGRRGAGGWGGLSRSPALAVPASGRIPAVGGTAAREGDGRPRAPEAGPGLGLFERVCSSRKKTV